MSRWPATPAGTLHGKQTFSPYLTSLFDHCLKRKKKVSIKESLISEDTAGIISD